VSGGTSEGVETSKDDTVKKYRETVENSKYIIHALGGMEDEFYYINSIDCLEKCYAAGYRLFEADVSFTSDDVLVLAHSGENNVWSKNDWTLRLGQEYPFDSESSDGFKDEELTAKGYDVNKHLCPYSTFKEFRIQGKYSAGSFSDLLNFMEQHDDMYVMVDAGHRNYEDTVKYYKAVVEAAGDRQDLLDHLIAGGQTTEMVKAAREAYDFPLINLYFDSDEKREEQLSTPEKFVKYCRDNDIISYSTAKEYFSEDNAKTLEKSDLISYIFTVNDKDEESELRSRGADIIGTDFLWDD
jgi:glycerophosphoryl diester phosphodiesterase